ncbi:regulatory protein RecX [Providencia vermicola]|uniref:Regulatory protein RecX n=1 Tax=Providencia stuartii TaxID=588 RepID=A0AAI9HYI6_PROST|nr:MULTISPECIES: regulatory protein RecX [Providencia]ELR5043583.1 regulatory protein RecX [Providencia rettgeri]ELR5035086.1 regulatory protein RecX [Providencia stuartii]ELR5144184.1 regulatory protein RecX [Providencia stuartii]ELR5293228.1 regulatory protein RecX [Providencia stuartii]ELZ5941042.1 regulatory protein RecX [Providencia stuartii]
MTESELYQYALFMLSRRDYGTEELNARMKRRMYEKNEGIVDETLIERVIARLSEQHFLDDTRVLELHFQSYIRKGYGPLRIKQELRQKGFAATLIDQQFENTDVDWFELAATVRRKKFSDDIPSDFKEKSKQIRYLQYRGFSGDMIFEQFR